jgi:putative transposase
MRSCTTWCTGREASRPNEIWQADHTQLDLWVITPSGQPARPWLTAVEDDHSRAVAGYGLNLGAPSALNTALAFRQAIWRKEHPDWHVCAGSRLRSIRRPRLGRDQS